MDLLLSRPGSRVQEAEADYLGLLIMAKSCYDPDEAVKLWERMQIYAEQQKNDIPQFLSTHPSNRNRIKKIAGWLPQALALREHSACGFESRFSELPLSLSGSSNGLFADDTQWIHSWKPYRLRIP